jgi:hypothetical protein
MAKGNKTPKNKPPRKAPFDQGALDFFRASRGNNFSKYKNISMPPKKDFTGFRRGSK